MQLADAGSFTAAGNRYGDLNQDFVVSTCPLTAVEGYSGSQAAVGCTSMGATHLLDFSGGTTSIQQG